MAYKKRLLIEKLTSYIRMNLLEQLGSDDALYQAFFVEPDKYELKRPDPESETSGKEYQFVQILSTVPESNTDNPSLSVKVFPTYEAYIYDGPSTGQFSKGDRVIFDPASDYEVIKKGPKGEDIIRRQKYKDPSEKFGGLPEYYTLAYDSPTVQTIRLKYNDAKKDGYEATLSKGVSTRTIRNISKSDVSLEDGAAVYKDIVSNTEVFYNATAIELTTGRQYFETLHDLFTYKADLTQGEYIAATSYAIELCEKILEVTSLEDSAKTRILKHLENIKRDPNLADKTRLRIVIAEFTAQLKKFARSIDKSSPAQSANFMYDHIKERSPYFKVFRKKLTSFEKFDNYDYITNYPGRKTAFQAAADDFIKALSTEKAFRAYFELKFPGNVGLQKSSHDELVARYEAIIKNELSKGNPDFDVLYELRDMLEEDFPDISSIRDELRAIYLYDYSRLTDEEGFIKAADMFKEVLKTMDLPSSELIAIVKELYKLEPKTPFQVLNFINKQIRIKEGGLPAETLSSKNQPGYSEIMAGTVVTDSPLPQSKYDEILKQALKQTKAQYQNLTHSGLSSIVFRDIQNALDKVENLSEISVIIEGSVDMFDFKDVFNTWLTVLYNYAQTALHKLQPDTGLRFELEELALPREFESVEDVQDFLKIFKKLGDGTASESSIDPGFKVQTLLTEVINELRLALKHNKNIDKDVKSVYVTKIANLLRAGKKNLSEVDRMFGSDLNDIKNPAHRDKEELQLAFEDGLNRIRKKGVALYNSRKYRPIFHKIIETDLESYDTLENVVLYLIEMLGPTQIESFTSRDLTADVIELSHYVLKEIVRQAPNFDEKSIKLLEDTIDNSSTLQKLNSLITRTFGNRQVLTDDVKRNLLIAVTSFVKHEITQALDSTRKLTDEVKKLILIELMSPGKTSLIEVDSILKALTGINQTGLEAVMYAKGGIDNVRNIFASIVAKSNMSLGKKKQVFNTLYGVAWNDQSDRRPMTSVPKVQQYAVNMALASVGLHTPKQKKG